MSTWWSGPGHAGPEGTGPGHPGSGTGPARAGAWFAQRMSGAADRGVGYAEAAGAAVWGGACGAAGMARQVWLEDRPRRQFLRARRRRLWWDRGGEWRLLVGLEVIGVAAWVTARSAWRITRATPRSTWDGAGQGWHDARTRRAGDYPGTGHTGPGWTAGPRPAPGRTRTGGPGPDPLIQVSVDDLPRPAPAAPGPAGPVQTEVIVDADVVDQDGRPAGTGTTWTRGPAWTTEVLLEMAEEQAVADDRPTCTWPEADGSFCGALLPDDQVFCDHHGRPTSTAGPARPTRRPDRLPETDSDTRMFDLREAGYAGWIDQDGYAVDADGRRLSDAELADAIATGRRGDWGATAASHTPVNPPQDPGAGQPMAQLPDAGPTTQPSTTSTQEEHLMSMPTPAGTASTSLGGELTGPGDLLAETSHVQGLTERAADVHDQLNAWAHALPDLVTAAPWGTNDVATAADGIAQAEGTDNLRETITGLHAALDQAEQLGESLGSIGATGSVDALANGQ